MNISKLEDKTYESILAIVNRVTKMVHYERFKVTINGPGLLEVIINLMVQYRDLPDFIVSDYSFIFTSKF